MAYSPRAALVKSHSPRLHKPLGSADPLSLNIVHQELPKVSNTAKKTYINHAVVQQPPLTNKSLVKSQSATQVLRKLSLSSEHVLSKNASLRSFKPSQKTKQKPKRKLICEESVDTWPRTYGKYSNKVMVKKSSKRSSRPSISVMPIPIE